MKKGAGSMLYNKPDNIKSDLIEQILNELDFGVSYTKNEIWQILLDMPKAKNFIELKDNNDCVFAISESEEYLCKLSIQGLEFCCTVKDANGIIKCLSQVVLSTIKKINNEKETNRII